LLITLFKFVIVVAHGQPSMAFRKGWKVA
jgi:hypothetical protein